MTGLSPSQIEGSVSAKVLAVTLAATMVVAGLNALPVLLIDAIILDTKWPAPILFSSLSAGMFLSAVAAPASVFMISRFGVRNVMAAALAALVVGLAGSAMATSAWQLGMVWALSLAAGGCLSPMVIGTLVTSQWTPTHCGATFSLYVSASRLGPSLLLPLSFLIDDGVWLTVVIVATCFVAAILVAGVALLPGTQPLPEGGSLRRAKPPLAMWPAPREYGFLLLLLYLGVICGVTSTGLVDTHIISLCSNQGLPLQAGATAIAIAGVAAIAGGLASGSLADRFDPRWLLAVYYFGRSILLVWLPYTPLSFEELSRFGLLYGLDWAATMPALMAFAARRFGAGSIAFVMSMMSTAHLVGAASTTFLVSAAGPSNIAFSFVLGAVLCLFAVLLLIATSPRVRRSAVQAIHFLLHGRICAHR